MKKISSYIPSLILSVLLVFTLLGSVFAVIADTSLNSDSLIKLAEKKSFAGGIHTELEKNFRDKYYITGIPSDIYMNSVPEQYIEGVVKETIVSAFSSLDNGIKMSEVKIENKEFENNIEQFFSDYADSIGYEKGEAYSQKVESAINDAYKSIASYCDVYKLSALSEHGVLQKLSRLYKLRIPLTSALIAADLVICLLLLIINRKSKAAVLYWLGTSSVVCAVTGIIPSAYLISTRYFDSFSIKQPQVFAAYTGMMYKLSESLMIFSIVLLVFAIAFYVIYRLLCKKENIKNS